MLVSLLLTTNGTQENAIRINRLTRFIDCAGNIHHQFLHTFYSGILKILNYPNSQRCAGDSAVKMISHMLLLPPDEIPNPNNAGIAVERLSGQRLPRMARYSKEVDEGLLPLIRQICNQRSTNGIAESTHI